MRALRTGWAVSMFGVPTGVVLQVRWFLVSVAMSHFLSSACQREHWTRGHKGQCKALAHAVSSSVLSLSGEGHSGGEGEGSTNGQPLSVPSVPSADWLCPPRRVAQLAAVPRHALAQVMSFSGVGIENCGNTCFLNSVLQCLAYSPPLCLYLQSKEHRPSCPFRPRNLFCALCAMEDWVDLLLKTSSDYYVRPVEILQNLRSLGPFTLGRQEDANEFFYALVESMQKTLVGDMKMSIDRENTTLLHQLFGGYKCHQMQCLSCGNVTPLKNFEYFLTLTLPLAGKLSLEEILHEFFRSQPVDGWKCGKCGKANGIENSCLYRTHPLLVLHLMRFDEMANKVNAPVAFRSEISIKPYLHPSVLADSETEYELYGVVVHFGNHLNMGHYVCFVKVQERWFLCDDLKITEVSPGVVLGQMAYLLFYQQKQRPSATVAATPKTAGASSTAAAAASSPTITLVQRVNAPTVHFRMDEAGNAMQDLVIEVSPLVCSSLDKIHCSVSAEPGKVSVQAEGGVAFGWTLPFSLNPDASQSLYYGDEERLILVVPIVSDAKPSSKRLVTQAVAGPVKEQVDADTILDVPLDDGSMNIEEARSRASDIVPGDRNVAKKGAAAPGAGSSFSSSAPMVSDWNNEASYQNLYAEIKRKPVVSPPKPLGATQSAPSVKTNLPKRNDKCYCGSGKKFKNCHG